MVGINDILFDLLVISPVSFWPVFVIKFHFAICPPVVQEMLEFSGFSTTLFLIHQYTPRKRRPD